MKYFKRTENRILLFILPGLIMFVVFIIIPVFNSVNLSFTNWDGVSSTYSYIGLRNFRLMLQDARFLNALKNTIVIGVAFTIFANIFALITALM
ncbi:sugar ABC transporter permease, partial [Candidatus Dojkabacteria bacterium]|nr:sugar ABC transporter permease [Candidatus Dojkabacteria bacterium]